eukprot:GSChrysophyteH1.ASY1.ANO1.1059.1 assembled CDS
MHHLSDPDEDLYSRVRAEVIPSVDDLASNIVVDIEEESMRRARAAKVSSTITAVGNFSIQYNYESVSIALLIMSVAQCTSSESDCKLGHQLPWVSGTSTGVAFAGSIAGQLVFGYLGDLIGRNKAMTLTLSIATIGAAGSAAVPFGSASAVYIIIIVFRFFLGVGVGGMYPLSATKAAEDAAENARWLEEERQAKNNAEAAKATGPVDSLSSARSFFWQAPGAMAPWVVAYLITWGGIVNTDTRWRLVLGLGALPSFAMVVLSLMENRMSPNKMELPMSLVGRGSIDSASSELGARDKAEINLWRALGTWKIQRKLIGTCASWFLYDACYFGVALFGGQIIKSLDAAADDDVTSRYNIQSVCVKESIALSMAIPSMLLTNHVLRYYSLKSIQFLGFLAIAVCFFMLALLTNPLKEETVALFVIYNILIFALAGGTGVTSYLIPSETFPKSIRATCNGISAASGKLGAVLGAYLFGPLADLTSFSFVFFFCCSLALAGAAITHYFIDEKSLTDRVIDEDLGLDIYGDREDFSIDVPGGSTDRDSLLADPCADTPLM